MQVDAARPSPLTPPPSPLHRSVHTISCWVSLIPTKIWFDYYWVHTSILCGVLLWATW